MNLIEDTWLPVIRQDGSRCQIAPWQIAEIENPVVELAAPRVDFQGALYQFLIGLLQTSVAPEDQDEWRDCWTQPLAAAHLQESLAQFNPAFELDPLAGPAFMQDFDLPGGEPKSVAALLIDAPGGKTLKDNLDHFVKGGQIEQLCRSCAATALFTLQANAPSGGVGHRVSLRGGGPLTTLVIPAQAETLWQKLWANVLSQKELRAGVSAAESRVFPWMGPTRCSDKGGMQTLPDDVHPLQMYWGMPRRIRLQFEPGEAANCSLCSVSVETVVRQFRTKNYGTNYEGPWLHPLTPYRFDPKNKNLPLSLKGQPTGLGYRHWLGLTWQDDSNGDRAAQIVRLFNEERADLLSNDTLARLWCFGYDMDNMKARCWYESTLPLVQLDADRRPYFLEATACLLDCANVAVSLLRGQVKAAWFSRPKDVKGDMSMVDQSFWQQTDTTFYHLQQQLAQLPAGTRQMTSAIAASWLSVLQKSTLAQFDSWALQGNAEDMNMKRIIRARKTLNSKFSSAKPLKNLKQIAEANTEAA
jgi:CRISPR system Cascade subunit CasA